MALPIKPKGTPESEPNRSLPQDEGRTLLPEVESESVNESLELDRLLGLDDVDDSSSDAGLPDFSFEDVNVDKIEASALPDIMPDIAYEDNLSEDYDFSEAAEVFDSFSEDVDSPEEEMEDDSADEVDDAVEETNPAAPVSYLDLLFTEDEAELERILRGDEIDAPEQKLKDVVEKDESEEVEDEDDDWSIIEDSVTINDDDDEEDSYEDDESEDENDSDEVDSVDWSSILSEIEENTGVASEDNEDSNGIDNDEPDDWGFLEDTDDSVDDDEAYSDDEDSDEEVKGIFDSLREDEEDDEEDEEPPLEEEEDFVPPENAFAAPASKKKKAEEDTEDLDEDEEESEAPAKHEKKAKAKAKTKKKSPFNIDRKRFDAFLKQVKAELNGKDAPDEAEEEYEEESEDISRDKSRKKSGSKPKLPGFLKLPKKAYLWLTGIIFSILKTVLGILASIPIIGIPFKILLKFVKALEIVSKSLPIVLLIGVLVAVSYFSVPRETTVELPDQGLAIAEGFKYDSGSGEIVGKITNNGETLANVEPVGKLWTLQPTINPISWFVYKEVQSCKGDAISVDIDGESEVRIACKLDGSGFLPRASGSME